MGKDCLTCQFSYIKDGVYLICEIDGVQNNIVRNCKNYKKDKEISFNCRHCQLAYRRVQRWAIEKNININHPYLDKICKETKSARILKLIERAYHLGMARGILMVDSGHNKIVLSENEVK